MSNEIPANNGKKNIEGIVVSNKMDKTVVVAVNTLKTHRKYLKKFLVTKKYKAHDQENRFKVGDKVKIVQSSPKSRGKKWQVIYDEQRTVNSEQ